MAMRKSKSDDLSVSHRILSELLGDFRRSDYAMRLWDGSYWFPPGWVEGTEPRFTMVLNRPGSLRSMFESPTMLNLGEAFLRDVFDIEGDMLAACEMGDHLLRLKLSPMQKLKLAFELRSLPKESEETVEGRSRANLSGGVGSRERLRAAIAYHYDLPAGFWKLWLDPTLAYSCAYFKSDADTLAQAQLNKLDYVCRKLYLSEGERLLDLGCGWGGLAVFAAQNYGVKVTAITLSAKQAEYASERVRQLGLQSQCEILHLDFRDYVCERPYDKIACVGAVEHVPVAGLRGYFDHARKLLKPGGLFFSHGITAPAEDGHPSGPSFVDSYVFPDHGVTTISRQLVAAEEAGFEVRDVECLREHYMRTCIEWLKRIEENEAGLIEQSNRPTQRLFRLYVAAQAYYFKTGANSLHQALLAKAEPKPLNIPLTRAAWYEPSRQQATTVKEPS